MMNFGLVFSIHKKKLYRRGGLISGTALASHAGDRDSIPGRERLKSYKKVVTAPLPNGRQQV